MLKITKGLKPFIGTPDDDHKGITIYVDSKGDDYVRVKTDDEDFYIAAYDYVKGDKKKFTWNVAMKSLKADGLTILTKKQAKICIKHLAEVNDVLNEIGGDTFGHDDFNHDWYWTSTELDADAKWVWICNIGYNNIGNSPKTRYYFKVRPILNL